MKYITFPMNAVTRYFSEQSCEFVAGLLFLYIKETTRWARGTKEGCWRCCRRKKAVC
ncbi:hypothetical protein CLOSTMETH_03742 [[Clostridium] methylpentosum DSM 5476]|uniref:Uncharacterized protein n=1 Tax=[Clostridium] methylpentosum DSM 5476 TaxID=537013 RepID=C0EIP7_9FIRM|nr:hypothetical protein CLOSTMETH_03742 [[Clostridium] methylpentosum DSM 5476]